MKLVNAHKHACLLLLLAFPSVLQSQEIMSLEKLIDSAQVHNKKLRIGRNDIAIGKERLAFAKSARLPKITATSEYKYFPALPYQLMPLSTFNPSAGEGEFKEAQFGVPHNINAGLQLSMPLYNPQLQAATQNAELAEQLAALQYLKSQEQVYFEITTLYYNAQVLYHQLAFTDSNIANTTMLLSTMRLLHEQLLATGTDVDKVELQAAQLRTRRAALDSKYDQVLNSLKWMAGISADRPISVEPVIRMPQDLQYKEAPVPDIMIIESRTQLLQQELTALKRSRYQPTVSAFASYGTTGFGYDKKPSFLRFYPVSFAGIQLSYPIFNKQVEKQVRQKKLEVINSELQLQQTSEQNKMLVTNAERQRSVARESVATTEAQVELSMQIYRKTILQQKYGTASLTDVLLADNAVHEAQQNYVSAIIDYLKADLELKKLTGNFPKTK